MTEELIFSESTKSAVLLTLTRTTRKKMLFNRFPVCYMTTCCFSKNNFHSVTCDHFIYFFKVDFNKCMEWNLACCSCKIPHDPPCLQSHFHIMSVMLGFWKCFSQNNMPFSFSLKRRLFPPLITVILAPDTKAGRPAETRECTVVPARTHTQGQ